jgi:isocitrate/isopropylmalate dehydrogenase
MLQHLGEHAAAKRIVDAVTAVLAAGRVRTRDLGGTASTTDVRDAIVEILQGGAS